MEQSTKSAYFDNAATTFPKPEAVYSFMDRYYRSNGASIDRGSYQGAKAASSLMGETRELLQSLFMAPNYAMVIQPSATIALNTILRGLAWRDGMTVYVTPFEHNAVTRPLNYISQHHKIRIVEMAVNRTTLQYEPQIIQRQFQTDPPHVVIATHASNVCGLIAPVQQIFCEAKRSGAITILDMAQTAGLLPTNIRDSLVDYAVFAGHKTMYGPFGASGFAAREPDSIEPLIYGGTGIESANPLMPDAWPAKFEAGSHNTYAIAGLNAALRWIETIGIEEIYRTEIDHRAELLKVLHKFSFLDITEPKGESIGVVSCNVKGYSSDSIGEVFSEQGIACRVGLHCAPTAHRFLGTFPSGSVRFSVGYFTSSEDFRALERTLDYIGENM